MESRLFKTLFDDPQSDDAKTFERHLKELLSLDDEARAKCLEALPQLLRPTTSFQIRQTVEAVAQSSQIDQQVVEHALGILRFFVRALLSDDIPKEDHKHWADDLGSLPGIEGAGRLSLEAVIRDLVQRHSDWRSQDRTERALAGVLPCFSSMGATVEARGIKEGRYHWGTPVDKYEPKIGGLAYITSVHIGVDVGFPEDFYFQMDETDMDNMIATLLAAKKEIVALKNHLGGKRHGHG